MTKQLLVISALLYLGSTLDAFGPKTLIPVRSQAVNLARELTGWEQETHVYDVDGNYGTIAFALEYGRTFHGKKMAEMLFGGSCLTFSGSDSFKRKSSNVLADYFGLPRDFKSVVYFDPLISNAVFDFNWYMGLDQCVSGLYVALHLPIAFTAWDLNPSESVINAGSAIDPAGYMGPETIQRSSLPGTVLSAWQGLTTFGDMQEPLAYGLILERETESRVTEIQLSIGWDFLQDEEYHFGLFLRGATPTGNYRRARYLFEPVVGNDHHATIGGGATGHWVFWHDQEYDQTLGVYGAAVFEHFFNVKEKRSYDLKNGYGSRFMLLAEVEAQTSDPLQQLFFGSDESPLQYAGRLVPAINYTTFDSEIRVNLQADIAIELTYTCGKWIADLGYEFWARSHEELVCRERFQENRFGIKGDAQIYGFDILDVQTVALSTTQHEATITAGQGDGNGNFANNNADNSMLAKTNNGLDQLNNLTAADAATILLPVQPVYSSNQPILLTDLDIDINSALLPKAISHKLFVYFGGSLHEKNDPWFDAHVIDIYAGLGASIEWACHCFKENSAFSQWAAWAKVGVAF